MAMVAQSEQAPAARVTDIYCSFCLKSQHEVKKLMAGHGGIYICDDCVEISLDHMAGQTPRRERATPLVERPTEKLLALLAPIEETVEGKANQLQLVVQALRARSVSWARIGEALGVSRQSAWERFS